MVGTGSTQEPSRSTALRPFEPSDAAFLRDAHNDLAVQSMAFRAPAFPRPSREFERRVHEGFPAPFSAAVNAREFAIVAVHEPDQLVVGVAGLYSLDLHNLNAEIGVSIVKPEHRRRGLASDALRSLVAFAFDHLALHRLYCNVKADNAAGLRLVESVGFCREGVLRAHRRRRDDYVDVLVLALLASRPVTA